MDVELELRKAIKERNSLVRNYDTTDGSFWIQLNEINIAIQQLEDKLDAE